MRAAVAIDGQGRAWIFYATQRSGNFDIYARNSRADGTMSAEIRLTTDPGTDLFPVAATDSSGRVWLAWQAFRNNNLEVRHPGEQRDLLLLGQVPQCVHALIWFHPGDQVSCLGR